MPVLVSGPRAASYTTLELKGEHGLLFIGIRRKHSRHSPRARQRELLAKRNQRTSPLHGNSEPSALKVFKPKLGSVWAFEPHVHHWKQLQP